MNFEINKKKIVYIVILLCTTLKSQNTYTGVYRDAITLLDIESVETSDLQVEEIRKKIKDIKIDSFDLCKFGRFPSNINQGSLQTCTAFTLAYALKTFQEAQANLSQIYDKDKLIDSLVFSPSFLYKCCIKEYALECGNSISLSKALLTLQKYGSVSLKDNPYDTAALKSNCNIDNDNLLEKAKKYRIRTFHRLSKSSKFKYNAQRNSNYIERIKYNIIYRVPVVFATLTNKQFKYQNYQTFNPGDNLPIWESQSKNDLGYHAMLIVGFNDRIQAFKIYNSYGKYPFIYMKYEVFDALTDLDIYETEDIPNIYQDSLTSSISYDYDTSSIINPFNIFSPKPIISKAGEYSNLEFGDFKIKIKDINEKKKNISIEIYKYLEEKPFLKQKLNQSMPLSFKIYDGNFNLNFDDIFNKIAVFKINKTLDSIGHNKDLNDNKFPINVEEWDSIDFQNKSRIIINITGSLDKNGILDIKISKLNNTIDTLYEGVIFYCLGQNGEILKKIITPGYGNEYPNESDQSTSLINYATLIEEKHIIEKIKKIQFSIYQNSD